MSITRIRSSWIPRQKGREVTLALRREVGVVPPGASAAYDQGLIGRPTWKGYGDAASDWSLQMVLTATAQGVRFIFRKGGIELELVR